MELNPNHPVTSAMNQQWHKIVALLMHKMGKSKVEISVAEIEAFANSGDKAVAIQEQGTNIVLTLIPMAEAQKLAKKEGGLPH